MKKVHFLQALSIVLVISIVIILIICLRHDSPTTLKVIFNGPTVLVRAKDKPNVITVFSPRDSLHQFFPNDPLGKGWSQPVHISIAAEGLKPAPAEPALPIDAYFPRDFIANTDVWQRPKDGGPEDYLMTIELPLPDKITFMSPLHPVTFENGKDSYIAGNFILEYRVTDFGKILATSKEKELGSLRPRSSSDLQKQFETLCQKPEAEEYYDGCANMRNLLEQCAGAHTGVFFFGVGIPFDTQTEMLKEHKRDQLEAHAIEFFNRMLKSFPNLKGKQLAPKGTVPPRGYGGYSAMLMEASFRPAAPPRPRLLPVTAVIDCKAGNVIVDTQTTTQGQ